MADCAPREGLYVELEGVTDTFSQSMPFTIEACADATCHTWTVTENNGEIRCDLPAGTDGGFDLFCSVFARDARITIRSQVGDTVSAKVTIKDAAGDTLFEEMKSVPVTEDAPNGEACGPICYTGKAVFAPQPVSQ